MKMVFKLKNSLKSKFILIMLGIILSLMVLEITLRTMGIGYNLIYKNKTLKERKGNVRIFCVGESTTWGIGAKDPLTQSYPRQLEGMLNSKYPNIKIKVFYDQTIGQNTEEILLKLPLYIKKYQPQIIIFMTGINDWWNLNRSNILLFNKDRAISNITLSVLAFLDKFEVWKLLKYIWLSSGLYKERWNYWFPRDETTKSLENKLTKLYGKNYFNIIDRITERDLEKMVKVCKNNNINVILCNYPRGMTDNLYEIIKKIAEKNNILFVDNYLRFESLPEDEIKNYFWKDNWHPNEKGYRLVAENLYNIIIKNHSIEKIIK